MIHEQKNSQKNRGSGVEPNSIMYFFSNDDKRTEYSFGTPMGDALDPKMGRVGFEPTTPAMSRRYLNQAGPPAPSDVSMFGLNISSQKKPEFITE